MKIGDLKIGVNNKILVRQLEVVRQGLEVMIEGLNKINNGCPDCGNHMVIKAKPLNDKVMDCECSECGCKYVYENKNKEVETIEIRDGYGNIVDTVEV